MRSRRSTRNAAIGGGIAPWIATALLSMPGTWPLLIAGYGSLMGIPTIVALVLSRRLPQPVPAPAPARA
ncbi:hypothetical protein [Microbacterium luticocti]|uniref:hypothetical protein n=1 Tax=Microbacterium luticocti TaxID=451764 RepID=UPI000424455C|nr:hypothetical protein [Microbacterium luticocti]